MSLIFLTNEDKAELEQRIANTGHAFNATGCNLPVLYLTGDTTGMTKDDAVDLSYVYKSLKGTCSVKWQGASSISYPKKNYTIKFDQAFEAKEGWGEQKKYCLKANWMDASHARNLIGAKLWGKMCASRAVVNTDLQVCPNWGAVDGFPIVIMLNGEFHGLYTFNIPKDAWMLNMGNGTHEAILCAEEGDSCYFKALATLEGDFDVEYATNEDDTAWIKESLNRLINACINSDGSDIDTTIAQYLDIDSAIDYMIHVCVTANPDNLDRNYLLHTKDGVKWTFTAYDMDMGFGIGWSGKGFLTADDYPFFGNFAQLHRLMYLLWNYKTDAIKARYRELRNNALSEINMAKMLLDFASEIPLYVRNTEAERWPAVPSSDANTVYQIIEYLRLRYPKLDAHVESKQQETPIPAPVLAAQHGWFKDSVATIGQSEVTSVTFTSNYEPTGNEDSSWACDVGNTGSIMAYQNGTDVTVTPTTGAKRICVNKDSSFMFAVRGSGNEAYGNFASLASVTGTEILVAQSDTSMVELCHGNTALTTAIHIPEGVTDIKKAFKECTALTETPTLPSTLRSMQYAFQQCGAIEAPIIPEGVVNMNAAFIKANITTMPNIPSTVTDLGNAFQECYGITDVNGVVIPEGITNMNLMFFGLANASGTVTVNAQNITGYERAFGNAATTAGCQITITGSCPLLAELAATKLNGNVVVA